MPTTLLTGGNGFLGRIVLAYLLSKGHTIILPVRSLSSGEALLSIHPDWTRPQVSCFHLPDFTTPGEFDEIFKKHPEIEYMIHNAALLLDDPRKVDFIEHSEKASMVRNLRLSI